MGDLGKIIVATGFEKLPKVQLIAQSGHTAWDQIDDIFTYNGPFHVMLPHSSLIISVTRSDDFWKLLATNLIWKVGQTLDDSVGYFDK